MGDEHVRAPACVSVVGWVGAGGGGGECRCVQIIGLV